MKKISLTPKQQETLKFIKSFISQKGMSPTITELSSGLKLKSLRSVTQRIESLESKGFLRRDHFKHRGITLIEEGFSKNGMMQIPVIASAGCDAAEIYANENHNEYLTIDQDLAKGKTNIAAIKAVGNSMVDAGINNGDYVLVEVTNNVLTGDRVVAIIGDMAVIKRLRRTPEATILEPESEGNGYSPIIVSNENSRIFGKVLSVIPMSNREEDYQLIFEPGVNNK